MTLSQNKPTNTAGNTVYVSGVFTFDYYQEVSEDWWSNGEGYFPTSPYWKTGFTTVSYNLYHLNVNFYDLAVPNNYKPEATLAYSFELGQNSWTHSGGGIYGVATRNRDWQTVDSGSAAVTAVPN